MILRIGAHLPFMGEQGIAVSVQSQVHHRLHGIDPVIAYRTVQHGHTQGIVLILVPAILALAKHRHAPVAAFIRQIHPVLSRHFKQLFRHISPANGAQPQVKGSLRVGAGKCKFVLCHRVQTAPLDLRIHLYPAAAVGEGNDILKGRVPILLLHTEGHPRRAFLLNGHRHRIWQAVRVLVGFFIIHFPGRPGLRAGVLKQPQADGLRQQLLLVHFFVQDGGDVALFVQAHNVFLVLHLIFAADGQAAPQTAGHIGGPHIIDRKAQGRHRGNKYQLRRAILVAVHLTFHFPALGVVYPRTGLGPVGQLQSHRIRAGHFQTVKYRHRRAGAKVRFQQTAHRPGSLGQLTGKAVHGHTVVVPAAAIGALHGGARQIIVELMGDGTLPVQLHSLFIVMGGAQIIRHYAGTLRHIRQFLAAAVPALTHGPGSVAANAVILHHQFRLPPGQLGFLLRGQLGVQVTEQIIRTGRQHLHIAVFVFVDLLLYKGHRGFLGRTAPIADPVKNHSAVQIVFFVFIQLLLHKIPVPQLLQRKVIIVGVQTGQHLRAVRPLPHANIKRNAVGAAPTQLLGRKAHQVGVGHNAGQRPTEAKAVRQINIH